MFELLFKYSPWAYRAGELSFASPWPLWALVALVVVGLAFFAFTLYRQRKLAWWRKLIIGTLQTLLLATVLVMLWQPVLLVERVRDRENVVAVVMDASPAWLTAKARNPGCRSPWPHFRAGRWMPCANLSA
ncbi:MAG: hypothetical protein WDO68_31340 [Gammaproteobacteria bacterium]